MSATSAHRISPGRGVPVGTRLERMDLVALELFFVGLLGLASLAIVFVSAVVVKNLYRGQR